MPERVCYYVEDEVHGGAFVALLHVFAALDRRQWDPILVLAESLGSRHLAQLARERGVEVRTVPRMPFGAAGRKLIPAFVRVLRGIRPDIFHATLPAPLMCMNALWGAAAAGVPARVTTVQLFPEGGIGRSGRLQLRMLSRFVHRHIAVSGDIARRLVQDLKYPRDRVCVIRNGIDTKAFASAPQAAVRHELCGNSKAPVILTCGRLHEQKGLDVLLRAAAQVPHARFAVAGAGPLLDSLSAEAVALGVNDRVRFLGRRNDIPALLASCDVVVQASRYEGTSLSLMEAMAAGRPIISTRIPGTEEVLTDGVTGLLVPPGDADALAAALRRLLPDSDLQSELALAARERANREFGAEHTTRRVEAVYHALRARSAG